MDNNILKNVKKNIIESYMIILKILMDTNIIWIIPNKVDTGKHNISNSLNQYEIK